MSESVKATRTTVQSSQVATHGCKPCEIMEKEIAKSTLSYYVNENAGEKG